MQYLLIRFTPSLQLLPDPLPLPYPPNLVSSLKSILLSPIYVDIYMLPFTGVRLPIRSHILKMFFGGSTRL